MFAKPTLAYIAAVRREASCRQRSPSRLITAIRRAQIARSFGSTMSAPSAKAPEMLSVWLPDRAFTSIPTARKQRAVAVLGTIESADLLRRCERMRVGRGSTPLFLAGRDVMRARRAATRPPLPPQSCNKIRRLMSAPSLRRGYRSGSITRPERVKSRFATAT